MRRQDRGASTVEMAMYMPILFFIIFATVQAAMLFLGNQAASAAAREAARVARTGGGSPDALRAGEIRGIDYATSVGKGVLDEPQVRVGLVPGRQVRAEVDGRGVSVVPGLPGLAIHQAAQGPIEEFRPDQ